MRMIFEMESSDYMEGIAVVCLHLALLMLSEAVN